MGQPRGRPGREGRVATGEGVTPALCSQSDQGMKVEDYQTRRESHAGWTMNIVSYRLGDRFYCTIDDADPGARLSRGEGATRADAEEQALRKARRMLERTRTHSLP